jgi:predicted permease
MLAKRPGFALVIVLTVAIGIGANAAIFSVINDVFLRNAPAISDPDRLVVLFRSSPGREFEGFGHLTYLKYRRQVQSFSGLTASRGARLLWRDGQETKVLEAKLVTGDYFSVLGVPMAAGRGLTPEEDRTPGAHPLAVVSHDLWKRRFGLDRELIGRSLHLNDTEFTVVGVAGEGFRGLEFGETVDIWLPLMMEAEARPMFPVLNDDFFSSLQVVGRLRPGVSRREAEAELAVLAAQIEPPIGAARQPRRAAVTPHIRLPDPAWRAEAVSVLALLSSLTGLLLLVVCANVASLMLARSVTRRQEMAVRRAVGAGRVRILRQYFNELLVLAAAGATAGLVVWHWIARLIQARAGDELDLGIDLNVLLFMALLAVITAALVGSAPALHATRGDAATELKGQRTATRRRSWLLNGLVGGQVAAALVLLTGAGLFVRTLQKASAVEVGYETEHLYLVAPDLELAGYSDDGARDFYRRLSERLAALPGVEAVSRASAVARYGNWFWSRRQIVLAGGEGESATARVEVEYNEVAPGYFETLGVPLVRGRAFTALDDASAPPVAVVNETMARQLWSSENPLGKRVRFVKFMALSDPVEIVGIVRDSRTIILDPRIQPEIYFPLKQSPRSNSKLLIRAASGSAGVAAAIRREVNRLDPALPPAEVETLAERLEAGISDRRLYAELAGLLGGLALLLAAIGLYGTLALSVSQRTREIGIRMALGAQRGAVLWLVIREGLAVAAVGMVVGLLAGLAFTRILTSRLYGIAPTDPLTFATSLFVIAAVTVLACWAPARRATRVDPVGALRFE